MAAALEQPFVSIVVPTHDGAATLADCVESLLAQDYPVDRYEVVVVDNGSTDGGAARLLGRFGHQGERMRVFNLPHPDANTARNAGLQAARGDPVCLVDDDVLAPPTWLAALVRGLSRHRADCAGGPVRPRFDDEPLRTCERHALSGTCLDEGPVDKEVSEVWGGNMAVSRLALELAGPFRPGLRFHQEWEWQQRLHAAGVGSVYVADAWLEHRRRAEDMHLRGLLREDFRRGWFLGRYRADHQPPDFTRAQARGNAVRAGRSLSHGIRARCTRGLTDCARASGQAAASTGWLVRNALDALIHKIGQRVA